MIYVIRKPRWKTSCPHKSEPERRPREKTYFPAEQRGEDQRNYLLMEPEQYFENEVDNNHHNDIKSRNYFPSRFAESQQQQPDNWIQRLGKLDGKFFVELAIFIDQDLFKLMAENFPIDTEEHIIQVVLAMINAVSRYFK